MARGTVRAAPDMPIMRVARTKATIHTLDLKATRGLAEPETRKYFKTLIEFVDVWDKILADKLPHSIAPAIGHTEQNLQPFYQHIEEVHDRIRLEIS
jgi:hypothetical protein